MSRLSLLKRITNAIEFRIGKSVHALRDIYYKRKNIDKPKLFVFTDSRGYEVVKPWNKKSAYASYVGELVKHYNVDYVICPEFSTTVVDFIYEYQKRLSAGHEYDAVIAHVGVVDYSPRPVSMLDDMMVTKQHKIKSLFSSSTFDFVKYHQAHFEALYFGKPVKNFYSKEFLAKEVVPQLKKIENLVMIGCSPVLTDWHGNYWRERPANMDMILDYSSLCRDELDHFIDYSTWSADEVKRYTIDNIHLSEQGFKYSLVKIHEQLNQFELGQE